MDFGCFVIGGGNITCFEYLLNKMGFSNFSIRKTLAYNYYVQKERPPNACDEFLLFHSRYCWDCQVVLMDNIIHLLYILHYGFSKHTPN